MDYPPYFGNSMVGPLSNGPPDFIIEISTSIPFLVIVSLNLLTQLRQIVFFLF